MVTFFSFGSKPKIVLLISVEEVYSNEPKIYVAVLIVLFFQAPSFYWELEICHLGESSSDAAHIAMGYSPDPQKPPEGQPWAYPTEAVLMRRYASYLYTCVQPNFSRWSKISSNSSSPCIYRNISRNKFLSMW